MKYAEVTFKLQPFVEWEKDIFISELAEIGFDTFEDTTNGFVGYIPSAHLEVEALQNLIAQQEGFEVNFDIKQLENQNWNTLWESNFQPIVVNDECYVRATFHAAQPQYAHQIIIDPKMSFGTGHHQTTSMMLEYILENDFTDKAILDMGCGTGILAILAAQKNARHILAIDFDDICIDSVEENKILNQITNIEALVGSYELIEKKSFNIILANINRNILLEQFAAYGVSLPSGGELYISGFYVTEDLDILKQKASSVGFEFVSNKEKDNWCAAKFIKL